MVEKNRLEELIKQGATIYDVHIKSLFSYELNNSYYINEDGCLLRTYCDFDDDIIIDYLENLFETKEDAEWALRYKNIPRTEYLNLPTWEEIENDLKNCSDGDYVIVDDDRVTFVYYKLKKKPKLSIITNFDAIEFNATKDNYIKACELCRKLFLGEVEE